MTLWEAAGDNARALFIRMACDADLRNESGQRFCAALTVAQALETLKERKK